MAFNISSYVDPGVYISEEIVPGSVSLSTVPFTTCIIGSASRSKRALNEAVTRGLSSAVALTVASTPDAHDSTSAGNILRQTAYTTVLKDGVALVAGTDWSFLPASFTGQTLTTLNFTTNNKFSLSLDGLQPVTIIIIGGASDVWAAAGSVITMQLASLVGGVTAVTPSQIVEGINKALGNAGASALGYGPSYGAVASTAASQVTITSPLSTSQSAVRFFTAFPVATSLTATIFTNATPLPYSPPPTIRVVNAQYSSLSVYTANVIKSDNSTTDPLVNSNVSAVLRIGSYANTGTFVNGVDYSLSGNAINWAVETSAVFTSGAAGSSFDVSTNDRFMVALDGLAVVTIDLNGAGAGVPGYVNPSSPAAATPTELANNINAVLAQSSIYGPLYAGVATVSGSGVNQRLVLTSPKQGIGSFVELAAPAAPASLSCVSVVFGLISSQLPYFITGTGTMPAAGAVYFVSYSYARPTGDYVVAKRFFTPDAMYADIGFQSASNPVAVAGAVAFENGAPSVIVIQANDSLSPGTPTQSQLQACLAVAGSISSATEVVVLSTALGPQTDLLNHVVNSNSPTVKMPRRGWFGMNTTTVIGDRDTPDTWIYRAVRTLQVAADSPGRGRLLLIAPSNVTRTITNEDGSETDLALDSTFVAAAVAGKMSSFQSPSSALIRKTITGFRVDNFPTFLPAERRLLASNGVFVVTADAGVLILLDPMTTEAGGGKLPQFAEPSASTQKDAVTAAVQAQVDANVVGIVPDDLGNFVLVVKGYVAAALKSLISSGTIGPFRDDANKPRSLDMLKDIQVFQDPTDPTKFSFKYWYNLRYPAKRFFGVYSVDRAFFS